jgi:hypothetical protein
VGRERGPGVAEIAIMFHTVRQFSELMQPADGQPYIGSIDVGGEYYGTGDGSGKAFWPG